MPTKESPERRHTLLGIGLFVALALPIGLSTALFCALEYARFIADPNFTVLIAIHRGPCVCLTVRHHSDGNMTVIYSWPANITLDCETANSYYGGIDLPMKYDAVAGTGKLGVLANGSVALRHWQYSGPNVEPTPAAYPVVSVWEFEPNSSTELQFFFAIPPLGLLFAWIIGPRIIARRRLAQGRCVHCGYDMRATPDRCPECGTVRATRST